ncbi:P2X purinoceptor 7 isoform X2 [Bombina bombina]|nr:P2X purinoceptor 7 isoform X2 [Bombina bombina]
MLDKERHSRPLPIDPKSIHMWDPITTEDTKEPEKSALETDSQSTSRIGKNDWCSCSNCIAMPTEEESVCCREIRNIDPHLPNENLCVCDAHFVQTYLMNRAHLKELHRYASGFKKLRLPSVNALQEMDLRRIAYRKFTMWIYKCIGPTDQRPIPSCLVKAVRSQYPAQDDINVGFHTVECDGNAAYMIHE